MADRPRALTASAARIGRTDLGEVDIALDDEALSVVLRGASAERAIRIELLTIEAVSAEGNEVTLPLRGGTRLTLVCETALETRDAILGRCRLMPELTSALRALGSRRGHRGARPSATDEQRRFFAPLLHARREAGDASGPLAAIAAFEPDALASKIRAALRGFAGQRFAENTPERRALEAELLDAIEPLDAALAQLRGAAQAAVPAIDELQLWRAWARELRFTFETADRAWLAIDAVLDSAPRPTPPAAPAKQS